jgi:invasion protein IalB
MGREGMLVCLVGIVVASHALAQNTHPATDSKEKTYSAWIKLCDTSARDGNKELCFLNHEKIDGQTGSTMLAVTAGIPAGGMKQQVVVTLPEAAMLSLPAGVRLQVDNGNPILLVYAYCYAMNCRATTDLTQELLKNLRKGKELTVTYVNLQGKAIDTPVTLTGFSVAYDGPPADSVKYSDARLQKLKAIRQRHIELAQTRDGQVEPSSAGDPFPSQPQPVYPDGPPR